MSDSENVAAEAAPDSNVPASHAPAEEGETPSAGPPQLGRWDVLKILCGVGFIVLLGILVLSFFSVPTDLELAVDLSRVVLTVEDPRAEFDVLHPDLRVAAMQWQRVERFEASLSAPVVGRASVENPAGAIGLQAAAGEWLRPELKIRDALRVNLQRGGRGVINAAFQSLGRSWRSELVTRRGLSLRLRDVVLRVDDEPVRGLPELADLGVNLLFEGGRGAADLGLKPFKPASRGASMQVIDPETREAAEPVVVDVEMAEPRELLAVGERVVLLERLDEPLAPVVVLADDLFVRDLVFFRDLQERPESFLLGGKIRYLGGEKESLDLDPGFLLSLKAEDGFRMKSLRVGEAGFQLILWGRPSSLRLGPSQDLQREILPNLFVWLQTHKTWGLVCSTLALLIGSALTLLRFLGLAAKQ